MNAPRARRPRLRALATALACAALAGGCEPDGGDTLTDFENAVPDVSALHYAFPDVDTTAISTTGLGLEAAALVGGESELYTAGRDATRAVNRALDAFLLNMERVLRHLTPERVSADRVVWRGIAPNSLDEDLFVMQRADDGHFEYSLWSRERLRPDAEWRFRLYGSTTPIDGPRRGRGALWVDLESDRLASTRGKVLALWENLPNRREVAVTFFSATTDDAPARTRSFIFTRTDAGSLMAYGPEIMDIHDDPAKDALEEVRLLTRWNSRGIGRSDATVTGGDVATGGYAVLFRTECWQSPGHEVTYEGVAVRPRTDAGAGPLELVKEDGDRATCPLADPETAVVPPVGTEPEPPALPPEASEDAP
ncbi:MAG: hypothetical protein EP329_07950 [Deltaproteobacteria bacterium]|nr:MAG: hypothetical protein EP329_07950 [Deltaproteobacteria bacterium]